MLDVIMKEIAFPPRGNACCPSFVSRLSGCSLHVVHETVMKVEWNDESEPVEVAIGLHLEGEEWLANPVEG